MPEMQAHPLGYVEPDNIGLDDKIFQVQYWNETGGWYFIDLSLIVWQTEDNRVDSRGDQWWEALAWKVLTKLRNESEFSNSL